VKRLSIAKRSPGTRRSKTRASTSAAGRGRYTVDAAAKALELLTTFSFNELRLSLSDLAARTGIPRAMAFRLLSTLEGAGFVVKENGDYRLGVKCFVLGNVAAANLDLRQVAFPHLSALRDLTGETTHIAVLDNWQVVYLERLPSPKPVGFMRSRPGAILPAHCTALGKVLLAHRDEAQVSAWAASQNFRASTANTITTRKRLIEELRATRARGYAVDEQEHELGVRCIAAPVRNHQGEVIAAISVAGPTERMPRVLVGSDTAKAVVAAAQEISIHLGAAQEAVVS
jgi:DNA-binding IclR family transcriptional regulator